MHVSQHDRQDAKDALISFKSPGMQGCIPELTIDFGDASRFEAAAKQVIYGLCTKAYFNNFFGSLQALRQSHLLRKCLPKYDDHVGTK
jgi:hypothetical protein